MEIFKHVKELFAVLLLYMTDIYLELPEAQDHKVPIKDEDSRG